MKSQKQIIKCNMCNQEIRLRKSYEVDFGLIDTISDDEAKVWYSLKQNVRLFCPKCILKFKEWWSKSHD